MTHTYQVPKRPCQPREVLAGNLSPSGSRSRAVNRVPLHVREAGGRPRAGLGSPGRPAPLTTRTAVAQTDDDVPLDTALDPLVLALDIGSTATRGGVNDAIQPNCSHVCSR